MVPRNEEGPLRTWPLLIVILSIPNTRFLQRVRVFFKHFRLSSKTTPLSKSAHFWGSAASWCAKNGHFQQKERVWERNLKVQRRSVKSTIPDRPQSVTKPPNRTPETLFSANFCKLPNFARWKRLEKRKCRCQSRDSKKEILRSVGGDSLFSQKSPKITQSP